MIEKVVLLALPHSWLIQSLINDTVPISRSTHTPDEMGAGGLSWGEPQIVKLISPPYYNDPSLDPTTTAEHKMAQDSWQDIVGS
jgi:hypothetical protein